jgi:uridylate kinase
MPVAISLGGSLVYADRPRTEYIKGLVAALRGAGAQLAIVVGGGRLARRRIEELGSSNKYEQDLAAIGATYENAQEVAKLFPGSVLIQQDIEKCARALSEGRTPITGGVLPGLTTDSVAALLAERIGAERLVNLSNVDGIYDSDPKTNPKARKYPTLTHEALVELAAAHDRRNPRENFIVDIFATKILCRSNIEAHFVNGNDLAAVKSAVLGRPHCGTVVRD